MGKDIFVLSERKAASGDFKKITFELISQAKKFAATLGSKVLVGVLGHNLGNIGETLGEYGADAVYLVDHEALKVYSPEAYASAACQIIKTLQPLIVMGPASAAGKDYIPRVAAKLDIGLAMDCTGLELAGEKLTAIRPVYAGKAIARLEFTTLPQFATIRPNVLPIDAPQAGRKAQLEKFSAVLSAGDIKAKIKEIIRGASEKVDLTEANIIVSGGRAMKSRENFKLLEELADVIGATVGASRAAVDSGYADHSMQVGQTGKTVNPTLYIACGISGAIQHLAGMRTSKVIVAINKDPDAPIFQKADFGIVGDLFKIVPLLTQEFKKLLAE
jgi:electron transfer flavoprotein alpha subunit